MSAFPNPAPGAASATLRALRWLRTHWLPFLLTSAALLLPLFWHRHVQAGDLGSHLYTAWLSQSVEQGLLPGLHLDRQYTNVLIDVLLARLLPYCGLIATARIAVAFCVLVFFWGSFALASAAAGRAAWSVAPLLAMLSYGAIFHWGFFNCYLSVGFSFFGLALIAAGSMRELALLPLILFLSALAHPFGSACLVALGLYLLALRLLPKKFHLVATVVVIVLPSLVRSLIARHLQVLPPESHRYWLLGADQFIVFDQKYLWIAVAVLALSAIALLRALRAGDLHPASPWMHFYFAIALVVALSPGGFYDETTFGIMGFLPDRASLYSVAALAAVLAFSRPRRWFLFATSLIALCFFAMLFGNTAQLERRYEKVAQLVRPFAGKRVISLIPPIPGSRIHEDHAVDLACIGHCYSYNNYEPSSKQFRLKAAPGNRFVEMNQDALDDIPDGNYVVQPADIPVYEVYACGPSITDLCITELKAGHPNGEVPNITSLP